MSNTHTSQREASDTVVDVDVCNIFHDEKWKIQTESMLYNIKEGYIYVSTGSRSDKHWDILNE